MCARTLLKLFPEKSSHVTLTTTDQSAFSYSAPKSRFMFLTLENICIFPSLFPLFLFMKKTEKPRVHLIAKVKNVEKATHLL